MREWIMFGSLVIAIVAAAMWIGQLEQRVSVVEDHSHAGPMSGEAGDPFELHNDPSPGSEWSPPQYCPANQYVCGMSQLVEPYQAGGSNSDDSGVNGVRFYCCALKQVER